MSELQLTAGFHHHYMSLKIQTVPRVNPFVLYADAAITDAAVAEMYATLPMLFSAVSA